MTAITTLRFSINQTLEYDEDGGGKEGGLGVIPADASLCPALVDSLTRPNAPVMTAAAVDSGCRVGAVGECGRGECVDAPGAKGVCVCEPDIIGLRCSHSLLEDLRYLPAEDPRLRVRTDASCGETLRHEQLALHLAGDTLRVYFACVCMHAVCACLCVSVPARVQVCGYSQDACTHPNPERVLKDGSHPHDCKLAP